MWLPTRTGIDLPLIPGFDKASVPVIVTYFACLKIAKIKIPFFAQPGLAKILVLMFLILPVFTVLTNLDPIVYPWGKELPSESVYNGISIFISGFIKIVPYFISFYIFRTFEDHLNLFRMFIKAGLIYSVLILIEIRLSPQLNNWIYGFMPHQFAQSVRSGGFRAMVFMGHGLTIAFFMFISTVSAALFWKLNIKVTKYSPLLVLGYFIFIMIIQKSMASLIYALTLIAFIKVLPARLNNLIAKCIIILTISYPILSILHYFPHEEIINFFGGRSSERAASLAFRFDNENLLLEHAKERLTFGWGGWGRWQVFAENQTNEYGVSDGLWIITLASSGIAGFIALFGFFSIPVFKVTQAIKRVTSEKDKLILAAHSLLLSFILVDQIPNASLESWVWLLVGSLMGRCDFILNNKPLATNNGTI